MFQKMHILLNLEQTELQTLMSRNTMMIGCTQNLFPARKYTPIFFLYSKKKKQQQQKKFQLKSTVHLLDTPHLDNYLEYTL